MESIEILTYMPPTTRRRHASAHAADSTRTSTPEARAGHQPQSQRRVRKVTLRLGIPQPNPSSLDPHGATPVPPPPLPPPPPPLEVHGPLQNPPPPPQHVHVPYSATGHPVLVGSQHDTHDPAMMNVPPAHAHPYMPFYPPPFPQYPHIPPYGASIGTAHAATHEYMAPRLSIPFLSQLLAMQYTDMHSPAPGGPAREGALAHHTDLGGANGIAHTDVAAASSAEAQPERADLNKEVSVGGKFHVPLQGIYLLMILKSGVS
jgi:hypothetical protein